MGWGSFWTGQEQNLQAYFTFIYTAIDLLLGANNVSKFYYFLLYYCDILLVPSYIILISSILNVLSNPLMADRGQIDLSCTPGLDQLFSRACLISVEGLGWLQRVRRLGLALPFPWVGLAATSGTLGGWLR